jgi:5-(carboxyamino)imidazole ribonucleotide synthase
MTHFFDADFKLGVLGGGQLGRMLIEAGGPLNIWFSMLDPAADAPCAHIAHEFVQGSFDDYETVLAFGRDKSVITVEIEHVSVPALKQLKKQGKWVYPSPEILEIVQDKGQQKQFFENHGIPTSKFELFDSGSEALQSFGTPCVLKLRKGGYDGRGVMVIKDTHSALPLFDTPVVAEEKVDILKELSVIVSRNASGQTSVFPSVEMYFNSEANLVELLFSPANISPHQEQQAQELGLRVAEAFNLVGIMAVEMFLTPEGTLLVNEVAPRPHNSGHHSIEANITSQYQQHLRALLNLPPGDTALRTPAAMANLLGAKGHDGPVFYQGLEQALATTGVFVHLYGKSHTKPFRKMGHITALANTSEEACAKAQTAARAISVRSSR